MKKFFVAIFALAVLCNLAAADWNTDAADYILNSARRMDEIKYTRQRQAQPYGSTSSSSYRKPRNGTYDNTRYNPHPHTETRTGSYGQTYYGGPKSGEYYVNKNGNRTYYTKVPETQPVYTGSQGGSYYYTTSGKKRYIRSK